MARQRVSTTVDEDLLTRARAIGHRSDAALLDAALEALLAGRRQVEIDGTYSAYDDVPLDSPDEWGDLESFRQAAAAS